MQILKTPLDTRMLVLHYYTTLFVEGYKSDTGLSMNTCTTCTTCTCTTCITCTTYTTSLHTLHHYMRYLHDITACTLMVDTEILIVQS